MVQVKNVAVCTEAQLKKLVSQVAPPSLSSLFARAQPGPIAAAKRPRTRASQEPPPILPIVMSLRSEDAFVPVRRSRSLPPGFAVGGLSKYAVLSERQRQLMTEMLAISSEVSLCTEQLKEGGLQLREIAEVYHVVAPLETHQPAYKATADEGDELK